MGEVLLVTGVACSPDPGWAGPASLPCLKVPRTPVWHTTPRMVLHGGGLPAWGRAHPWRFPWIGLVLPIPPGFFPSGGSRKPGAGPTQESGGAGDSSGCALFGKVSWAASLLHLGMLAQIRGA